MARLYVIVMLAALLLSAGCGDTVNNITSSTASTTATSQKLPLNALQLQQFANPLIQIPVVQPNAFPPEYVVTVKQKNDFDFGLRDTDGNEIMNPASGTPIRSTTWGYDINGTYLGIYGPTVEAQSGTPISMKFVNDLRDANGKLLTKHLLTVDPTVDGASRGEPEVRIVAHLHGGDVTSANDGWPMDWVTNDPNYKPLPGMSGKAGNTFTYTYPNVQQASTLWFHDHSMGVTRLNAYAGLAAVYLIRDQTETALNLPSGTYEVPLVLQDKNFNNDGSLEFTNTNALSTYNFQQMFDASGSGLHSLRPENFGTVNLVNAQAWPYQSVEPRRYRYRIVNGADSRVYNLWLQDADTGKVITDADLLGGETWPVIQIGAEQGLARQATITATGPRNSGLMIAPGERADIIIDFNHRLLKGKNILLRNDAPAPFGGTWAADIRTLDSRTTGKVMKFKQDKALVGTDSSPTVAALLALNPLRANLPGDPYNYAFEATATNRFYPNGRPIDLQELRDQTVGVFDPLGTGTGFGYRLMLSINGLRFSDPVTEKPVQEDVEDWVLINTTADMHPMHLHLVKFEVLEKGYIDTTIPNAYVKADGVAAMPSFNPAALVPNAEPGGAADSAPAGSAWRLNPSERRVWKDTVRVPPAGTPFDPEAGNLTGNPGYVKIRMRFKRAGKYVYHCHILSHEEHEMMRPFEVVLLTTDGR